MLTGSGPHPPHLIIVGAPASGKGTQCEKLREEFNVVHLSTGDMLREAVAQQTDVGLQAKEYMDRGDLVPDSVIIGVIVDRLKLPDCLEKGWILDGFPRTAVQAKALVDVGISFDSIIYIDINDSVLVERVVGRRQDPVSGKIYHMKYFPPENEEIRARLLHRSDDTEAKVKVRLKAFHENAAPVLETFPHHILKIDGDRDPAHIWYDLRHKLRRILKPKVTFMIGEAGVGKSTQCRLIKERSGLELIDLKDLLVRELQTNEMRRCAQIESVVKEGGVIPGEVCVDLLIAGIQRATKRDIIIDNFPRNFDDIRIWFEKTGKDIITDFVIKLEAPALLCKQRSESRQLPPQKNGDSTASIVQRIGLTKSEDLPDLTACLERIGKLRVVPALVAEDPCFATISGMLASRALIPPFERTLAMIKPDAVRNGFVAEMISQIAQNDLVVVHTKFVQFDSDGAQDFYAEHVGKGFFPNLEAFMTSGPAVVLILEGPEAVFRWRALMGPTNTAAAKASAPKSLRAQFGTDGTQNACHGSDSPFSSMREINFWYCPVRGGGVRLGLGSKPETAEGHGHNDCGVPREITFGIIKPLFATVNYDSIVSLLYGHGFTIVSETKRVLSQEHVEFIYRDQVDMPLFPDLRSFLLSGPVDLLILERSGAIQALRYLIGPTNLKKAKKDRPSSIRAMFGLEGVKNVMHGSASTEDAARCRQYFFTVGPVPEAPSKLSVHQGKMQATINAAMQEFPATYQMNALAKVSNRKRAKVPPPFSMQKFDYLADYLASQVDPVIKDLMTHLMQHRPTDVVSFAIKDLLEMQRESMRASTPEAPNSPMKKFASNSPMKTSQSTSALPPIGSTTSGQTAIPMPALDDIDDSDLTPEMARNQIVRLKTVIDEITHNMQEMAVNTVRGGGGNMRDDGVAANRSIGIVHMGDTYDFASENVPLLAANVHKISLDLRAAGSGDALILHSGGFASGGPMLASDSVKEDLRKMRISVLNSIGVHFGAIGFTEVSLGVAALANLLSTSMTTWLCGNLIDPFSGRALPGVQKTSMTVWNDVKVGLVGLVGDWLNYCPRVSPNDVQYLDIYSTAKQLCEELKSQGAEIIIALTHCDAETDKQLAAKVPEINLILGGHGSSYRVVTSNDERTPCIVKSGCDFADFSFVKASFDTAASGRPAIEWPPKRYSINAEDSNVTPSQVLIGLQTKMVAEEARVLFSDIIGYSDVVLDATKDTLRSGECPVGNLVADAVRHFTSVDIALVNAGFIGSNSSVPPGFISFGTLSNLFPHNDKIVVLSMTGADLVRCLEHGVSRLPSLDGRFLHTSGIIFDYCPDAPRHHRIAHVQVATVPEGKSEEVYESLVLSQNYVVAVPEYIAKGNDGFSFLKQMQWQGDPACYFSVKSAVLEHFKERYHAVDTGDQPLAVSDFTSIAPKVEGRINAIHAPGLVDEMGSVMSDFGNNSVATGLNAVMCEDDLDTQSISLGH